MNNIKNNIYTFTSESVTEGHPDKICDQIADAILDYLISRDPNVKLGCEVMIVSNTVIVAGEVNSSINFGNDLYTIIVRETIRDIGYDDILKGLDYKTCEVKILIQKQSKSLSDNIELGKAGDQTTVFGYAKNDNKYYLPYPILISSLIAKDLDNYRKDNKSKHILPDGKVQVTVKYINNIATSIENICLSVQHKKTTNLDKLKDTLINNIIIPSISKHSLDYSNTKYIINPSGNFTLGGPSADTGLTGRKLMVDTYGGYARNGGGALSGKDPSKLDRSASYMARYIAKNLVYNKICTECEIQISYIIGQEEPLYINISKISGNTIEINNILNLIKKNFKLSPTNIIKTLDLKNSIYYETSKYGHFTKQHYFWEQYINLNNNYTQSK